MATKMGVSKKLKITRQPDELTCGPSCLHSIYRYFEDRVKLSEVLRDVSMLESGGTLGVSLANHALARGYQSRIYAYNLQIFDPSWFPATSPALVEKLIQQVKLKRSKKLRIATDEYLSFLKLGGEVLQKDLTASLIRKYLKKDIPLITGLSASYLYQAARENPETNEYDDVGGYPSGHFVVIYDYDVKTKEVSIADPFQPNPIAIDGHYRVRFERLIGAIFLGVLTYDANLIVIQPKET